MKKFPDLALKETNVRRLKNRYKESTFSAPADNPSSSGVQELLHGKTERLLMLGEDLYKLVRHYLMELHDCGGVVNTCIVIADELGVVTYKHANLLAKYGGDVILTKH